MTDHTAERAPAALREQLRAAIESAVYDYRELTCQWDESDGTTEEITRRATAAAVRALGYQSPAEPGTLAEQAAALRHARIQRDHWQREYERIERALKLPGQATPIVDRPFRSHRQQPASPPTLGHARIQPARKDQP